MAFGPDVLRIDPVVETDRIAQFLQEQVKSVYKRSGIVVGLSGGIDSAVMSELAVRAVGKEAVKGIILPEKAQEKPREGEVVAVGPGKLLDSGERKVMGVKVGDVVVYSEYGGTEVSHEGEDYLLIDEGSILAVKE